MDNIIRQAEICYLFKLIHCIGIVAFKFIQHSTVLYIWFHKVKFWLLRLSFRCVSAYERNKLFVNQIAPGFIQTKLNKLRYICKPKIFLRGCYMYSKLQNFCKQKWMQLEKQFYFILNSANLGTKHLEVHHQNSVPATR